MNRPSQAASRRDKALPFRPVTRETVQDRVHGRLLAMILDGEIEPGETVTITALAEAFGVSAMPVREALHRLTAAGALTIVAGRSVGIPALSVQRLLDLQRVRVEIEGLAAEWAARAATPALLSRLDTLIAEMSRSADDDGETLFIPPNREFHFAIYEAAGSEVLIRQLARGKPAAPGTARCHRTRRRSRVARRTSCRHRGSRQHPGAASDGRLAVRV
jgi:DNA-binding GntR family transcriptional regulator